MDPSWDFRPIIHFRLGLSIINHPFWDTSIYGNHPFHIENSWQAITILAGTLASLEGSERGAVDGRKTEDLHAERTGDFYGIIHKHREITDFYGIITGDF